jgi:hypothetical protein
MSLDVHCTLGNCTCKYCTDTILRNYKRMSDIRTHAVIRKEQVIKLGLYCENECTWLSNMTVCPIPAAREVCRKAIAEFDPNDPVRWMKRKGVV